ncbi:MAG: hypothetical protein ACK5L7_02520 [Paludibacteraceae bacterium]
MEYGKLTEIFKQGAGLFDGGDGVLFGRTYAPFVPDGLDAVMLYHCGQVDVLLQKLPKGSVREIELFATRGFTMQEYQALFDLNIREKDFHLYPVFRSLWINTEKQRRKLIYTLDKEKYYDYWQTLSSCMARFNPSLLTFFFRTHPFCQVPYFFPQTSRTFDRKERKRKIQNAGDAFL